jgi:hypothetical protein
MFELAALAAGYREGWGAFYYGSGDPPGERQEALLKGHMTRAVRGRSCLRVSLMSCLDGGLQEVRCMAAISACKIPRGRYGHAGPPQSEHVIRCHVFPVNI